LVLGEREGEEDRRHVTQTIETRIIPPQGGLRIILVSIIGLG